MIYGTHYYRPPFPENRHWKADMARIRESGLDTVQVWLSWAWVESKPGEFLWNDYDRLIELAAGQELGLVLCLVPEIQPCWIHREIPGSEMIDHMGHRVVSSARCDVHFGLTPGGCTDHPMVADRIDGFLREAVERYRGEEHVRAWDCWSELRWNVNADGLVCFCPHTLASFREYLNGKYGGIEGLNNAWKRRYSSWDDVMPGKLPNRPYTEMMAFEEFLTWRSHRIAEHRYRLVKRLSPNRQVVVHNPCPNVLMPLDAPADHALNRGIDWTLADITDGVGFSCFPKIWAPDFAGMAMEVDFTRSASGGKRMWLSELQGGAMNVALAANEPVDAASQQRWTWHAVAGGAAAIIHWCWRDEEFGREAGAGGLVGNDGLAKERLEATGRTAQLLKRHRDILDVYRPAQPEVGVLFNPQSSYLYWAQSGSAALAKSGLQGYVFALEQAGLPCEVVEAGHLGVLEHLRILFLPRVIVTDEALEKKLYEFALEGGTIVCESEHGAYTPEGFYRDPADRFLAQWASLREAGRRPIRTPSCTVRPADDASFELQFAQWLTPWTGPGAEVWAAHADGALAARIPAGKGSILVLGSHFGDAYDMSHYGDFERFVYRLAREAGCSHPIRPVAAPGAPVPEVYVRHGSANGRVVAFVFFHGPEQTIRLRIARNLFPAGTAFDLISGEPVALREAGDAWECDLSRGPWGVAVLTQG